MKEEIAELLWKINDKDTSDKLAELLEEVFNNQAEPHRWLAELEHIVDNPKLWSKEEQD